MAAAWFFIATCWIFAGWLYYRTLTRASNTLVAFLNVVVMFVIMFGSLWVPDLWL